MDWWQQSKYSCNKESQMTHNWFKFANNPYLIFWIYDTFSVFLPSNPPQKILCNSNLVRYFEIYMNKPGPPRFARITILVISPHVPKKTLKKFIMTLLVIICNRCKVIASIFRHTSKHLLFSFTYWDIFSKINPNPRKKYFGMITKVFLIYIIKLPRTKTHNWQRSVMQSQVPHSLRLVTISDFLFSILWHVSGEKQTLF